MILEIKTLDFDNPQNLYPSKICASTVYPYILPYIL